MKIKFIFIFIIINISIGFAQADSVIFDELESVIKESQAKVKKKADISIEKIDNDKLSGLKKNVKELEKSKIIKPKWITTFPKENGYFTGIGSSNFSGNLENDMMKAMNNALNVLAGQIEIKIVSESKDIIEESKGNVSESASLQIASYVKQNLEGIELVDAWFSKKEGVWYYYRLSEDKYKQTQNKRLEQAKELSEKNFIKGIEEIKNKNLKNGIIFLLQSYTPMYQFPLEQANVNYDSKIYNLSIDSLLELQKITSNINYKITNSVTYSTRGDGSQFLVNVTVDKQPLVGLPFYYISKNEKNSVYTDTKGNFVINLKNINESEKVFFGLDVKGLAFVKDLENRDYAEIENKLHTIRDIVVKKEGPSICLEYSNELLDVKQKLEELLNRDIKAQFNDMKNAKYIFSLEANYKPYPQNNFGFVITDGLLTVSMKENNSKKNKIFSITLDQVKGQGLDKGGSLQDVVDLLKEQIEASGWSRIKDELDKIKIEVFSIVE